MNLAVIEWPSTVLNVRKGSTACAALAAINNMTATDKVAICFAIGIYLFSTFLSEDVEDRFAFMSYCERASGWRILNFI